MSSYSKKRSIIKNTALFVMLQIAGATWSCSQGGGSSNASDSPGGGSGDDGAGGGEGGNTAVTQSLHIGGTVSDQIISDDTSQEGDSGRAVRDGGCASAAYEARFVGGDGTVIGTGQVQDDSTFALTYTEDLVSADATHKEVVVTFRCGSGVASELRCFGAANETALTCDLLSNGVALALEDSVGAKLDSSPLFSGVSVSKIISGIRAMITLVANIDPENTTVHDIQNATTVADIRRAIVSSPAGAMFRALEKSVEAGHTANLIKSQGGGDAAVSSALADAWGIADVVAVVVGQGMIIEFDPDESDGSIGPYGEMADRVDALAHKPFMARFREYIYQLYVATSDTTVQSDYSIVCVATEPYNWQGGSKEYRPEIVAGTENAAVPQLTCRGPAAVALLASGLTSSDDSKKAIYDRYSGTTATSGGSGAIISGTVNQASGGGGASNSSGCTLADSSGGSGGTTTCQTKMLIRPIHIEASRNDKSGTYEDQTQATNRVLLVGVFPEFFMPQADTSRLFSGLAGLYLTLTAGAEVREAKLSLCDIHSALTDGLSLLVTGFGPAGDSSFSAMYVNSTGSRSVSEKARISDLTALTGIRMFIPQLLRSDVNAQGSPILSADCLEEVCGSDGTFRSNRNIQMTGTRLQEILDRFKPSFETLFGDLKTMPRLDSTLKSQIYTGSHHEGWNLKGDSHLYVIGKAPGAHLQADRPILCAFLDSQRNPVSAFTPNETTIECIIAEGTWEDGRVTNSTLSERYKQYFGLMDRGRNQEDGSQYFTLVNLTTGDWYRYKDQEFRLRDVGQVLTPKDPNYNDISEAAYGAELYFQNQQYCQNAYAGAGMRPVSMCWNDQFWYVPTELPNAASIRHPVSADQSFCAVSSYYPSVGYAHRSSGFDTSTDDSTPSSSGGSNFITAVGSSSPNQSVNDPNPVYTWGQSKTASAVSDNGTPDDPTNSSIKSLDDYAVCLKASGVSKTNDYVTSITVTDNIIPCAEAHDATPAIPVYFLTPNYASTATSRTAFKYVLAADDQSGTWQRSACEINATVCGTCYAEVSLGAIEAELLRTKGHEELLGPRRVWVSWSSYRIASFGFSHRFDPFCIDNGGPNGTAGAGDGVCDCYRDMDGNGSYETHLTGADAADCNVGDQEGDEYTVSNSPVWQGSSDTAGFWALNAACGNLAGAMLTACLQEQASLGYNVSTMSSVWWAGALYCATNDGQPTRRHPDWVDGAGLVNANAYSEVGYGCGTVDTGNASTIANTCSYYIAPTSSGPVYFPRLAKRKNAYNIARPQTLYALLSVASATVGGGVTVEPTAAKFRFSEALAMAQARLNLPLKDVAVVGPDYSWQNMSWEWTPNAVDPTQYFKDPATRITYPDFHVQLKPVMAPDMQPDLVGVLLRKLLIRAGILEKPASAITGASDPCAGN